MAASLALAGCSNEEFGYEGNEVSKEDRISTKDLNLVFTKADAQTRAQWDETKDNTLKFYWTDAKDNDGNVIDKIGMVYTGQSGTTGVTNYGFEVDSLQLASFKKKDNQGRWTGFYQIDEQLTAVQNAYTTEEGNTLAQGDLGKSESAKFKTTNDYL